MKPIRIEKRPNVAGQLISYYKDQINDLDKLIAEVQEVREAKFTEDEAQEFLKDPKAYVKKLKQDILVDAPFKNADADFNLKAMGKNFSNMDAALKKVTGKDYKYRVNTKGTLEPLQEEIEKLTRSTDIYTDNDTQTKTARVLLGIASDFNKLLDLGVMTPPMEMNLKRGTNFLLTIVNGKVALNSFGINQIK